MCMSGTFVFARQNVHIAAGPSASSYIFKVDATCSAIATETPSAHHVLIDTASAITLRSGHIGPRKPGPSLCHRSAILRSEEGSEPKHGSSVETSSPRP